MVACFCQIPHPLLLAGLKPYAALRVICALALFEHSECLTIDFGTEPTTTTYRHFLHQHDGRGFRQFRRSLLYLKAGQDVDLRECRECAPRHSSLAIFQRCDVNMAPKQYSREMGADGNVYRSPLMAKATSSVAWPRPLLSSSSRDRRSLLCAARPSTSLESSSVPSVRTTLNLSVQSESESREWRATVHRSG